MPTKEQPVDEAPGVPGEWGVDSDPYLKDDGYMRGDQGPADD